MTRCKFARAQRIPDVSKKVAQLARICGSSRVDKAAHRLFEIVDCARKCNRRTTYCSPPRGSGRRACDTPHFDIVKPRFFNESGTHRWVYEIKSCYFGFAVFTLCEQIQRIYISKHG